jgi:ribose 1,5-bisphosphokinase
MPGSAPGKAAPGPGRLVLVTGASGAGKDSLLAYARERARGLPLAFAHRYITRPARAGGENHVALEPWEFALRRERGAFALHWEANGLHYGLGLEIDAWLRAGLVVVANGSRAALGRAGARWPGLVPVLIRAAPQVLEARLLARGREDAAAVRARVARAAAQDPAALPGLAVIANDGPLEQAGERLLALLRALV